MTTKMLDTTVSEILQPNVEYVSTEDNPIATIQTEPKNSASANQLFDFDAEHNGEACIESLRPEDRGTERQFWFTVAMLCVIYGVAERTLRDNLESIINDGELVSADFRRDASILDISGVPHKTTIYNLEVLNKLGMCCFRGNKKAKEIRNKFNDVLVKHETGVAQPELTDAEIMSRALEIAHRTLEAREERIRALTAERDEAIRTKALIGSKREATAMATASAKSKECEKLREQIGDSKTYKAATAIAWLPDYFDMSNRGLYGSLASKLKKLEAEMPPAFAHIDIQDSRWGSVKAYHVAVIERLHEMVQSDENLMKKYRKIASV